MFKIVRTALFVILSYALVYSLNDTYAASSAPGDTPPVVATLTFSAGGKTMSAVVSGDPAKAAVAAPHKKPLKNKRAEDKRALLKAKAGKPSSSASASSSSSTSNGNNAQPRRGPAPADT